MTEYSTRDRQREAWRAHVLPRLHDLHLRLRQLPMNHNQRMYPFTRVCRHSPRLCDGRVARCGVQIQHTHGWSAA